MKKLNLWFIVGTLILIAFIGVGVFLPKMTVKTSFLVNRSEATTFKVMTLPSNISLLVESAQNVRTIVGHDKKLGSQYQMSVIDGTDTTDVDMKLMEVEDLEGFEIELTDKNGKINTTYELVRAEGGTKVQVEQVIAPSSWWGRSTLPFRKGTFLSDQMKVNADLANLVDSSPESVLGDSVAVTNADETQMLSFKSDGTLDWKISVGDEVYPLNGLHYKRVFSVNPEYLDISGFTVGPLQGLMLYGILDMSKMDTLRFDAESGLPDDDRIRPKSFTSSTVTYVRIR